MSLHVPECVCMEGFNIDVLQPVHPRDELAVPLDPVVLDRVFKFFRAEGFSEDLPVKRDKDLPKGVWKRKVGNNKQSKFLVQHRVGAARKSRLVDTVDEALEFQSKPVDDGSGREGSDTDESACDYDANGEATACGSDHRDTPTSDMNVLQMLLGRRVTA